MAVYVIAYDVGTTGMKTCLFEIDKTIIYDKMTTYNAYLGLD